MFLEVKAEKLMKEWLNEQTNEQIFDKYKKKRKGNTL